MPEDLIEEPEIDASQFQCCHDQDPYPFRVLPQVDGICSDALDALEAVLARLLSAGTENALIASGQAFPNGYSALVNRYFTDVAADSGKTTNVYYTATQYSGIQYRSTFAGSTLDSRFTCS